MERRACGRPALALAVAAFVALQPSVGCGQGMRQRRETERARKATLKNRDATSLPAFVHGVGYRVLSFPHRGWDGTEDRVDVAVWYPTDAAMKPHTYVYGRHPVETKLALEGRVIEGRFPLVLYSHGATGTGLSMTFLTERLASQGYVVAGVDYPDKYFGARISGRVPWRLGDLKRQLEWIGQLHDYELSRGGKAYRRSHLAYRPEVARAAIDLLLSQNRDASSPFSQRIDPDRVALVGHSFGAWTSMLLAGADPLFHDPRVKAVVALSGPCNDGVYEPDEVGRIRVPIMFMYGSEERRIGRGDDKALLYDRAKPPKFLLEIEGADHFAFSGGIREEFPRVEQYVTEDPRRAAIVVYSMAFLDFYLKNDRGAENQLKTSTESVASFLRDWGHSDPVAAR